MRIVVHIERDRGEDGHYGIDSFAFRNDEDSYCRGLLALFGVVEWNVRKLMRDPHHVIQVPPWLKNS